MDLSVDTMANIVIVATFPVLYFAIYLGAYDIALENVAVAFLLFLVNALVRNGHRRVGFVAYWGIPVFTELRTRRVLAFIQTSVLPVPEPMPLFIQAVFSLIGQLMISGFLISMCTSRTGNPPEGMDQKAKWTEYNWAELRYWIVSGNQKLKRVTLQGHRGPEAA